MFGLPPNIDKSVQRYRSARMLTQLQLLQAQEVSSKRMHKEELRKLLVPVQSLWDSLKESLKPEPKNKDNQRKSDLLTAAASKGPI